MNKLVYISLVFLSSTCLGQDIADIPNLNQLDSTSFELTFTADSAAIVTVHAAEDTTYRSAFIFLGRTVGEDNRARIKLEGLRNNANYVYRIFLGTELNQMGGSFKTGFISRE